MVNKNAKNINNLFYGRFQDYAKNQPKEIKIKDISNESAIKKYWSIEKKYSTEKEQKIYEAGFNDGEKNFANKIKFLLCKHDGDYDSSIISPKFLSDYIEHILSESDDNERTEKIKYFEY